MRQLLCLFIFIYLPAFGQNKTDVQHAIEELNGPKALLLLGNSNSTDLQGQLLLTEAWKLYGNDEKEYCHALRAHELASSKSLNIKRYFEARLLQAQYKSMEATQIFLSLDYEKLGQIEQIFLLGNLIENQSDSAAIFSRVGLLIGKSKRSNPLLEILQATAKIQFNDHAGGIEILKTLFNHSSPYIQIKAYLESGKSWVAQRKNDQAIEVLSHGLELAQVINHHKSIGEIAYQMSLAHARSGNFEEALPLTELGASSSQLIGNMYQEFRLNNIRSWAYFITNENFNHSLALERRQSHLVNQLGDAQMIADIYNNLGYDLTIAGTVPLDSTIGLMTVANNTYASSEKSQGRWYTLMNLVWQNRLMGNFETSVLQGYRSVSEARKLKDRHAIIEACFQLGESLMAINEMAEAARYYKEAKDWAGDKVDRDRYVNDIYYARFIWESGGDKSLAIKMLEDAVDFLKTGEVFYEMHARALLATYYLDQGKIDPSKEQLSVFKNPRNNYISFETRVIAALAEATITSHEGDTQRAQAILHSFLLQAEQIKAKMLQEKISGVLELLDN